MACELVIAPTGGAPLSTDDYDAQNNYIQAAINKLMSDQLHLTQWNTLTIPKIRLGVYIQHGGAMFVVKDANEDITDPGGLANGRIYIKATRTGDVLTFAFVDSAAGYSWNFIYCGFYHADGTQLLPYILVKNTNDYYKHKSVECSNIFDLTSAIKGEVVSAIGTWDMDATASINNDWNPVLSVMMSGLSTDEIMEHIISFQCNILDDTQSIIHEIFEAGHITAETAAGRFIISRDAGGTFDSVLFNDGTMNRGYIHYRFWF